MAQATIYGSFSGDNASKYELKCECTSKAYEFENMSDVTVQLYFRRIYGGTNYSYGQWNATGASKASISIDGSSSGNVSVKFDTRSTTAWILLQTYSVTNIAHNSDGTKSISISASFAPNATNTLYGGKVSGTFTLDTIPRASSFMLSAQSVNIGENITVSITKESESFYHSVYWYVHGTSFREMHNNVDTTDTFTIPPEWASTATSVSANVALYTYNSSGVQVGSTLYKGYTITVPEDIKPSIEDITLTPQDYEHLIQGKNKLLIDVTGCVPGEGSSIKSYTFSGPGISTTIASELSSASATSGIVFDNGNQTYTVTVTDARGRTASISANIECYEYFSPYFTSFNAFRCNANGQSDENGMYVKCPYKLDYASVNQTNDVNIDIFFKKNTDESFSFQSVMVDSSEKSGTIILSDVDTSVTYVVYASISDNYGGSSSSTSITIFSASRILNITRDGTGIAIGKMADHTKLFDVRWPIKSDDPANTMTNLSYRGENIIGAISNDTVANWISQGNLALVCYNAIDQLIDQPSPYGFLLNITNGPSGTDVNQLWMSQPDGGLFHRSGNADGWNGTWSRLLDTAIHDTDDVWTYQKLNNGFADCYGYLNIDSLDCSRAWGVLYATERISLPNFPFKFIEIPDVYLSWNSENSCFFDGVAGTTTTNCGSTFLLRAATGTITGKIAIHVHGKWK